MMFPSVAPLLLLLRKTSGQRGSGATASTWLFAGGYLLVWSTAGVVTWALVQIGIELGSRLGSGDRETWAPIALGATLVVAGVYQFTPLKSICLRQCQSPVGFLMSHWRSGSVGAVRMGIEHGAYCLGCCWALFAVLVAAGVMSLAWMLLLTLVVFTEKVPGIGAHCGSQRDRDALAGLDRLPGGSPGRSGAASRYINPGPTVSDP
jgi:predicted metal-binding membrane protein